MGLSGERVRQLENRLRAERGRDLPRPPLPQLDAALAAVARATPLPAPAVGTLLLEAGLTAVPFSADSLVRVARWLGRDLPFVMSGDGCDAVLLPRAAARAAAHAELIEARARRQVERCGAATLASLGDELAGEGVIVSGRQLRIVLEGSGTFVVVAPRWFSFSDARATGAFVRACRRMLAVTSPLPVESLHSGLCRHNSFRRLPPPPPIRVLAEAFSCHPCFVVEDGLVSSAQSLHPSIVGQLNAAILKILRRAPGHVLARTDLLDACHHAGLNLTSVNLYTTYSECLERVGPGLFAPRGAAAARPAAKRTVRSTASRRAGDVPLFGWSIDGRPWLETTVTPSTWANGVVHVPARLRPLLENRRFACLDTEGAPVTTLGVDRHGNSWGWTGFLRRAGAEPGQVVRATFDPVAGSAVMELMGDTCPSSAADG